MAAPAAPPLRSRSAASRWTHRLRLVDVLEDGREKLLAEPCPVRVVWRFAFAPPADPVRDLFEDHGVADQQLDHVGFRSCDSHRDTHQVALALEGRPAAFPCNI